jgi:hypothetical protein
VDRHLQSRRRALLRPVTYPISKVTGHVSAEASRGPNWSEVTRGDKARHLYLWDDGQQWRVTFVHVTIGRFLRSGEARTTPTNHFLKFVQNLFNAKQIVKHIKNL